MIIDRNRYFLKHYLQTKEQLLVVQRAKGQDVIFEYRCECEAPVAYACANELGNLVEAIRGTNVKGLRERDRVLFLLSDAVVMDSKHSLVLSELGGYSFDK